MRLKKRTNMVGVVKGKAILLFIVLMMLCTAAFGQMTALDWAKKGADLFGQNKYNEALQTFDKAIEVNPQLAGAWTGKGITLKALGRYDEAIQAFDKAIEIDPQDANSRNDKEKLLKELGRTAEADAAYAKTTQLQEWNKTFEGEGSSVEQTSDGGFMVFGSTKSYADVLLIKTDANGNKLWDKTFERPGTEIVTSVQQTSDGGYIILAIADGLGKHDIWLIKADANGNKLWDKTFVEPGDERGYSVQQTSDGGYIILGNRDLLSSDNSRLTSGNGWLIKTDAEGNKLWDKTFVGYFSGQSVKEMRDGGYSLCGFVWIIRTDANGNKLWDKTFDESDDEVFKSLKKTSDRDYIFSTPQQTNDEGYIIDGSSTNNFWLIKTDAKGNKLWKKTFENLEGPRSIEETVDGGYIFCGDKSVGVRSDGVTNQDIWLIKTDVNGNKLWERTFGGPNYDLGSSVKQTSDGGYIILGWTYPDDIRLIKIASTIDSFQPVIPATISSTTKIEGSPRA